MVQCGMEGRNGDMKKSIYAIAAVVIMSFIIIGVILRMNGGDDYSENSDTYVGFEVVDSEIGSDHETDQIPIETENPDEQDVDSETPVAPDIETVTVDADDLEPAESASDQTMPEDVIDLGQLPGNIQTINYTFRNSRLLNEHYEKHGIEMGFASAAEYEAAASAVINNPAALSKTEKDDGDYVYYVEATNEFVILSKDGYIRTYFLPSAGKAYYDRQ